MYFLWRKICKKKYVFSELQALFFRVLTYKECAEIRFVFHCDCKAKYRRREEQRSRTYYVTTTTVC